MIQSDAVGLGILIVIGIYICGWLYPLYIKAMWWIDDDNRYLDVDETPLQQ